MFRKEALEGRRMIWRGNALLLPGISSLVVIVVCLLFLFSFLFFVIAEDYTRRVTVSGEITTWPRPVNIYSGVQGFVVNRFVTEGQIVKKIHHFIRLMSAKAPVMALSVPAIVQIY